MRERDEDLDGFEMKEGLLGLTIAPPMCRHLRCFAMTMMMMMADLNHYHFRAPQRQKRRLLSHWKRPLVLVSTPMMMADLEL